MIEYSTDGGATWQDVTRIANRASRRQAFDGGVIVYSAHGGAT